ncbi:MAG: HdeD family acid-resistance protein [Rhodanobacteraceae bacterium]|jgi:uncharacterized membrane protein HdeD (DUF308 family)|nr:HdeD family acid-resistance protein [Rhodanobacteraceae bacterium]
MNQVSGSGTKATGTTPGHGGQIVWGVLLIVAGILAVLMPAVAALGTAFVFGWVLAFGGAFELVHAIQARHYAGFGWRLASGLLTLVLGLAVLLVPLAGVASLALLVGAFLFAGGIVRSVLAFRLRPLPGWGWVLFDGLVSLLVAILIGIGWPQDSLPFIGLLTGFWLVTAGLWRIMLARFVRQAKLPP